MTPLGTFPSAGHTLLVWLCHGLLQSFSVCDCLDTAKQLAQHYHTVDVTAVVYIFTTDAKVLVLDKEGWSNA